METKSKNNKRRECTENVNKNFSKGKYEKCKKENRKFKQNKWHQLHEICVEIYRGNSKLPYGKLDSQKKEEKPIKRIN